MKGFWKKLYQRDKKKLNENKQCYMDRMERKKIVGRSERTIKTKLKKDNVNNYRWKKLQKK